MATPSQNPQAPEQAGAPARFENKSPFRKKAKKKDPLGSGAMTLGSFALIASLLVIGLAMVMSA